nr:ARM repeat superfamily protein isoform 1 [Ipomoea batatas]
MASIDRSKLSSSRNLAIWSPSAHLISLWNSIDSPFFQLPSRLFFSTRLNDVLSRVVSSLEPFVMMLDQDRLALLFDVTSLNSMGSLAEMLRSCMESGEILRPDMIAAVALLRSPNIKPQVYSYCFIELRFRYATKLDNPNRDFKVLNRSDVLNKSSAISLTTSMRETVRAKSRNLITRLQISTTESKNSALDTLHELKLLLGPNDVFTRVVIGQRSLERFRMG